MGIDEEIDRYLREAAKITQHDVCQDGALRMVDLAKKYGQKADDVYTQAVKFKKRLNRIYNCAFGGFENIVLDVLEIYYKTNGQPEDILQKILQTAREEQITVKSASYLLVLAHKN